MNGFSSFRLTCVLLLVSTLLISPALSNGPARGLRIPQLDWATYFGEDIMEVAEGVAVAPDGTIVATGFTLVPSGDWDDIDAFVARFSANGKKLLNVAIFDGGYIDSGFAVSVDRRGIVTVAGQTWSENFPVTDNALQKIFGGFADGFLMQLKPNADGGFDLLYSTFFGGSGEDTIADMDADGCGGFVVCGYTGSEDLPTTQGAFQDKFAGGVLDAFVTRIVPRGAPQLAYSTYLGGSGDDSDFDPIKPYSISLDERLLRQAVAVMPTGFIVVAGMTWSTDFPVTPGALQTEHSPMTGDYVEDCDMYVTVLNPRAAGKPCKGLSKQLIYSTYLGGAGRDVSEDIVVQNAVQITLVGLSRSIDFPVTKNAYQDSLQAFQNAVVIQLRPIPNVPKKLQLAYSTFLGGTTRDAANGVCQLPMGDIVVGGVATSDDFPTTDGSKLKGISDIFLTRLNPSRKPAEQLIFSTLFGGNDEEALCVGPVPDGFGTVIFAGDTGSVDLPGVEGSYDDTFGGGIYDAFVSRYDLGGPAWLCGGYSGR